MRVPGTAALGSLRPLVSGLSQREGAYPHEPPARGSLSGAPLAGPHSSQPMLRAAAGPYGQRRRVIAQLSDHKQNDLGTGGAASVTDGGVRNPTGSCASDRRALHCPATWAATMKDAAL